MSLPLDLVFVRHGQSEANVAQAADKLGEALETAEEIRARPDWAHRLSSKGIEQAEIAGSWIRDNIGEIEETFHAKYCSPFIRTRETALHLGGNSTTWRIHGMLHERDWGEFGSTPRALQSEQFPRTTRLKKEAPLYVRLDGGEALADSVALRVRSFRDTVKRKWDGKRLIAVTHSDVMATIRLVFEDMLPEQWHEVERDDSQSIGNCGILWYSRVNPDDPEDVLPHLGWRKMVQPDQLDTSPFDGTWQELSDNRFMKGAELLESVETIPNLL